MRGNFAVNLAYDNGNSVENLFCIFAFFHPANAFFVLQKMAAEYPPVPYEVQRECNLCIYGLNWLDVLFRNFDVQLPDCAGGRQ